MKMKGNSVNSLSIYCLIVISHCVILNLNSQIPSPKPYSITKPVRTAAGIDTSVTFFYEFDGSEIKWRLIFKDGKYVTLSRHNNLGARVVGFSDLFYDDDCIITVYYMGMERIPSIAKFCILDIDEDRITVPGWSGLPLINRHEKIPEAEIIDINTTLIYDRETCPLIVEIHDFSHIIHYRCADDPWSRSPWMLSEEDLIKKEFMLPDGRQMSYVSVRIVKSRTYERERIGGRKID